MNTCHSNMSMGQGSMCYDNGNFDKQECLERRQCNQNKTPQNNHFCVNMGVNQKQNNCNTFNRSLDVFKQRACALMRPPPPLQSGDVYSMFDLCDNEVLSLANTCGEITLSKQYIENEDDYEDMKYQQKEKKSRQKMEKKRAKERFKQCKQKAKMILKKYKDREKQRKAREKENFKRCIDQEKKKVKAAKERVKLVKKCTKDKKKENNQKSKQKLKRLKARLKSRCEDLKYQNPDQPGEDSCDSMDYEDPTNVMDELPCDQMECFKLESRSATPKCGCKTPRQCQPCGGNNSQRCGANNSCQPCSQSLQ